MRVAVEMGCAWNRERRLDSERNEHGIWPSIDMSMSMG